jgi:hypothetical protein
MDQRSTYRHSYEENHKLLRDNAGFATAVCNPVLRKAPLYRADGHVNDAGFRARGGSLQGTHRRACYYGSSVCHAAGADGP